MLRAELKISPARMRERGHQIMIWERQLYSEEYETQNRDQWWHACVGHTTPNSVKQTSVRSSNNRSAILLPCNGNWLMRHLMQPPSLFVVNIPCPIFLGIFHRFSNDNAGELLHIQRFTIRPPFPTSIICRSRKRSNGLHYELWEKNDSEPTRPKTMAMSSRNSYFPWIRLRVHSNFGREKIPNSDSLGRLATENTDWAQWEIWIISWKYLSTNEKVIIFALNCGCNANSQATGITHSCRCANDSHCSPRVWVRLTLGRRLALKSIRRIACISSNYSSLL